MTFKVINDPRQVLMIIDIFSSFDPFNSNLNSSSTAIFWTITIAPISLLLPSFWINQKISTWLTSRTNEIIYSQSTRTQGGNLGPMPLILTSLFSIIILVNLTGITPYLLSSSSHLLFTVSLGFPLWAALTISGFIKNPKITTANLLPGGAPIWLNPALIPIETIRILVRPITLTVRLAANIRAGHIVLGLIGIYCATRISTSFPLALLLLLTQVGYTLFEFAICLIQAYIFCLLLSLYSDEHPSN